MCGLVCYVSTFNSGFSLQEVEGLFNFVSKRNLQMGLTGVLLFSDNCFFQVLEGDFNVIENLFERIKEDTRHYNIIKIIDDENHERIFDEYFFGFLTVTSLEDRKWMEFFLENYFNAESRNHKVILGLMKKFLKRFQPVID